MRPYWFAWIAQLPPSVASVAMAAKVSAMPSSSGNPERTKGWSARAKTNGRTGRMHGLTIVRTPPRYDNNSKTKGDTPCRRLYCAIATPSVRYARAAPNSVVSGYISRRNRRVRQFPSQRFIQASTVAYHITEFCGLSTKWFSSGK